MKKSTKVLIGGAVAFIALHVVLVWVVLQYFYSHMVANG